MPSTAQFGVPENIIGLTVVAIGTSLPELITSVMAAKKGETQLAAFVNGVIAEAAENGKTEK